MNKDFELPNKDNDNENKQNINEVQSEKDQLAAVVAEVNKTEAERKEKEKIAALELERIKEQEKLKPVNDPNLNVQKEKNNLLKLGVIVLIFIVILIIYRIYLNKTNEPEKPKTIDEQIVETLNKRYGETFTKIDDTTYQNSSNKKITITTNAKSSSKLVIYDDYLNNIQIEKIKSKISSTLKNNGLNTVSVDLEPTKDCRFVGSCVNKYYRASFSDNTDDTKLSERSFNIVLKDYVTMDNVEFFNEFGFMIYIKITGDYSSFDKTMIKNAIKNLFVELNNSGYKNNLGYEIVVKSKDGIEDVLTLTSDGDKTGNFDIYSAKEN